MDVAHIGCWARSNAAVNIRPIEGPGLALYMVPLAAMLYLVRTQDLQVRYQRQQRPRVSIIRGEISEPGSEMAK